VTISVLRSTGAVTVPAGGNEPVVVAEALDHARAGDIPFRIRVLRGDVELARSLITLRIVREREVLVAARGIRRGERLGPGDLRLQRMVLGRTATTTLSGEDIVGREARIDLAEGAPLVATVLTVPPDIRTGQTVELLVIAERFSLSSRGEALNDGVVGQIIAVRRAADGRTVRGTVLGEGRVRLDQ
jgi:flagella basal body P-ring formation protein FlgA